MLTATLLSKNYPSKKALNNVTIQINQGQICGLLGRNGAGKTTLFRILCGLVKPDEGTVVYDSVRPKPVGGIIERPGLYPYLNAYDNLKIFASIQNAPADSSAIKNYLEKVGLPTDRKDPVRNFSLGMKQRLGIAIALLNNPEYLVLDEPFSGLDPIGVRELINLLLHLAEKENIAILLSSHLMNELNKCCHYLYVIDDGQIVNAGTPEELINQHVNSYNITTTNISSLAGLKSDLITIGINDARVACSADEIALILKQLLEAGIEITSCTPEITLEQLLTKTSA